MGTSMQRTRRASHVQWLLAAIIVVCSSPASAHSAQDADSWERRIELLEEANRRQDGLIKDLSLQVSVLEHRIAENARRAAAREMAKKKAAEEAAKKAAEYRAQAQFAQQAQPGTRVAGTVDDLLRDLIKKQWHWSPAYAHAWEVHIDVLFSQMGSVTRANVVRSSGNLAFDRSVVEAVQRLSVPALRQLPAPYRTVLRFSPGELK